MLTSGNTNNYRRFQFEPQAMTNTMTEVLKPYKENYTALFGCRYVGCRKDCGKLVSVKVSDGETQTEIVADAFIDASGSIVLSRDAGCAFTIGTEPREMYGERSEAEKATDNINGVSFVFRVGKHAEASHVDEYTPNKYIDISAWENGDMRRTVSCFNIYPNGDINVNMLPTFEGREYIALGDAGEVNGQERVFAYWHYLQIEKGLCGYTLKQIFRPGIREDYRLVGSFVLTENHIRDVNKHPVEVRGHVIAVGDHALDTHGAGGGCNELNVPYGIPFDCTFTREYSNLYVVCRGASFSHIAASTARLTRTMLSFGEGAGLCIADIIRQGTVDYNAVTEKMNTEKHFHIGGRP